MRREWGSTANGGGVSVWGDEKVLELESGLRNDVNVLSAP